MAVLYTPSIHTRASLASGLHITHLVELHTRDGRLVTDKGFHDPQVSSRGRVEAHDVGVLAAPHARNTTRPTVRMADCFFANLTTADTDGKQAARHIAPRRRTRQPPTQSPHLPVMNVAPSKHHVQHMISVSCKEASRCCIFRVMSRP